MNLKRSSSKSKNSYRKLKREELMLSLRSKETRLTPRINNHRLIVKIQMIVSHSLIGELNANFYMKITKRMSNPSLWLLLLPHIGSKSLFKVILKRHPPLLAVWPGLTSLLYKGRLKKAIKFKK